MEESLAFLVNASAPCVLFEDEHLLVVNKPAGLNTHSPAPFAAEGIFDWLRNREPRWANLAILHRMDKDTSGVMVFAKSALANRSLAEQFEHRTLRKKYLFLTDRPVPSARLSVVSSIVRSGSRYLSRPLHAGGERAETHFHVRHSTGHTTLVEANPVTGRSHQIRVQAAEKGFPILGDTLYGGTPAARLFLHSTSLTLRHPLARDERTFEIEPDFGTDVRHALRLALFDPCETNAYRLVHGDSDGWPGWFVDRLGDCLLSQSEPTPNDARRTTLDEWRTRLGLRGTYHKTLRRDVAEGGSREMSPEWIAGERAPERWTICENGLRFDLSFREGYSVGLFLDQRENRRRLLRGQIAANFPLRASPSRRCHVLNLFAYTCGFSVCAAQSGALTTSLDLSRKYLDWGKRNFVLNGLDPGGHDFIVGDAFDWLRRLATKRRRFDVIILDPPTFSRSKRSGVFQAEKDFEKLVRAALPLLEANGVLLASTNAARIPPEHFVATLSDAIRTNGRRIEQTHYQPQPPDFPVSRGEPAYLKTVWLRLD